MMHKVAYTASRQQNPAALRAGKEKINTVTFKKIKGFKICYEIKSVWFSSTCKLLG